LSNSPTQVDTIYLDIREVFDTISHSVLLNLSLVFWHNWHLAVMV